ncbi:UvrD-helicase domain-containing protein [Microlunatus sagamiharensis]|uniref:UvrD-helicase domain-containing protein n=1 Tax=Microlunatus sagamiharensis TaxID=546874 RepID=UPI0012FD2389|nr:UvrD-helicase domain-containing protein [Microlunatus sagamiharensis]
MVVPDGLGSSRASVLSRMASFVERAQAPGGIQLPRNWTSYKYNSLVAFYADARSDPRSTRWIAEPLAGEPTDVVFWTSTDNERELDLDRFALVPRELPKGWDQDFKGAVQEVNARSELEVVKPNSDVEISLAPIESSLTKGWTYDEWHAAISRDQRQFVDAPVDKSIRLRGPAGSGKTLALTLKAIREVTSSRSRGSSPRVLIVTHSWSLAAQISNSIDSINGAPIPEIDVFPLLEIARTLSPQYVNDESGFSLIGEDSFSGKQAQLDEILDVLTEFKETDWVTFRAQASEVLRRRIDSEDIDDRFALAWDLSIEFGSVIGASAIFPGVGAELRYLQLSRATWMLPLESPGDLKVVYAIYSRYVESLDRRALLTSDQVLVDLLSHLETHSWNRSRRSQGYDLLFVDEFHLFSPLERQVLHYLSRDTSIYPRVFMAVDPRQSPSEAFIGVAADETRSSSASDELLDDVAQYELTTVHRFTPEILRLVKHVHHEFPTLDLGHDWEIDFSNVESSKESGAVPRLICAGTAAGEESDIARAVQELYPRGRLALAIVESKQWRRYSALAARLGESKKHHVSTITSRGDVEALASRARGLVVGPAEYLAGLQFDTVLVAGIPDMGDNFTALSEKSRLLSLLYLALSRAERDVRVFTNNDDGGAVSVLDRAVANGLLKKEQGSQV